MDTQNCVICQNPANPGHDFDENGPHFMNFTKILKSSSTSCSNFDLNEFKSLTLNGHYKKICSTCHHQLAQFDTLTCQLQDLQSKINEICTVIKNKAVQSQQFRKGNIWLPTNTNYDDNGHIDDDSSFDAEAGANIDDSILTDFDFNFDPIEDHGVNEIDAKVNIKVESPSSASTLNLTSDFQLQLLSPHINETNDDDLDRKSKEKEEFFGLKKVKIFLKRIQLPCANGPYNIKDLKIANFILKDRERIKKYKKSLRNEKYNKRRREARAHKRKNHIRKVQDSDSHVHVSIRSKNTSGSGTRDFMCTYENCSKSFFNMSNYEDHVRLHTGECPFICEICASTFRSEPLLKAHFRRVHNPREQNQNQSKIKCPECGIHCNTQKRLDKHILEIHKGGLKKYLCEQCPRSFNVIACLNDHIKCTHKGEFYKCPYPNCKSKLTSNYSLSYHIKKVHEKTARFFCPECNKGFFKKSLMDRHCLIKHLGESSYEFACDFSQCTRRFMCKKALEIHKMMVHLNERPYKCSTCPKAFVRPRALQEHEILHTGIRDFICTYENCGQAYAIKSFLTEHIRKHHKNPDKFLSKNVQNRKGFRRRVNRVEIIKDNIDNDPNQNVT